MELREIQAVLDGRSDRQTWRQAVESRLAAIDRQRERLDTARGYLAHLATCPSGHPAATCPYLARQVDDILAGPDRRTGSPAKAP